MQRQQRRQSGRGQRFRVQNSEATESSGRLGRLKAILEQYENRSSCDGPAGCSCRETPSDNGTRSGANHRRGARGRSRRWGQLDRCHLQVFRRTSPNTTPTRYRACHASPTDWASSNQLCGRIPRQHSLRCHGTTHSRRTAFHHRQTNTSSLFLHDTHTPTGLLSEDDTLRLLSAFQPCVQSLSASCKTLSHPPMKRKQPGMGPVGGPVLGPFKNRTEALQAETAQLSEALRKSLKALAI